MPESGTVQIEHRVQDPRDESKSSLLNIAFVIELADFRWILSVVSGRTYNSLSLV
jgi:hypothetical protein